MWKAVLGYEGLYEISDDGRVRSIDRQLPDRYVCGRILRQHHSGKGYLSVALCKNGKSTTVYIHVLVANAFIPKPQSTKRLVINHIDGDKNNNTIGNLEWVTYSENNQHAYDSGLKARGERYYNSKLTAEQVAEIYANGKYDTYENIAKRYGVSKASIRDILIGKSWKHLTQSN